MAKKSTPGVKTLEQARKYVLKVKTCLIFGSKKSELPSLWDAVDLPERQPGEKGWGQKVNAVWTWKNELPALFPDEIYYGKLPNGLAMLMCLRHMEEVHYPESYRPLSQCRPLSRRIHSLIRREPRTSADLREALGGHYTKAQVDRALVELQGTLNIVRTNAPEVKTDTWVAFTEQYPDFAQDLGDDEEE